MFSKLIPLALYAFAFVQAIPFSENLNVGYGVSNKSEATHKVDRSVLDKPGSKPLRLFNVGVSGSGTFAGPGSEELLIDRSTTIHGNDGMVTFLQDRWLEWIHLTGLQWVAQQIGSSSRYFIKNVGRNAFVSIGENNRLIVRQSANPAEFILEVAVAPDIYTIRCNEVGKQRLVWEGIYDESSRQYGYVALRPPSAGNQHWYFSTKSTQIFSPGRYLAIPHWPADIRRYRALVFAGVRGRGNLTARLSGLRAILDAVPSWTQLKEKISWASLSLGTVHSLPDILSPPTPPSTYSTMFTKICLALALASSAIALSINTPTNPTSGGTTSITWSSTSSDPSSLIHLIRSVFSIELNHPSFNNALAIANNVDPANNNVTLTIPPVPAEDNYTLEFVNITNIDDVFATSGSFSIGAAVSASASATGSAGSGSGASGSATGSGSASQASATAPPSSGSVSGSASASASSPSGSAPPSGAASLRVPSAVALLGLVASLCML
ncbi:hypothetical protein B0H13DRAFT_1872715 [Mycena leptocephala]|nr:hypothetical protein B0H13DRAFT_1872715 [Mycena leptocephala]